MLGWSDGGITALIAAAVPLVCQQDGDLGANAYVTEQDTQIYQGKVLCPALLGCVLTGDGNMKRSQQSQPFRLRLKFPASGSDLRLISQCLHFLLCW